MINYRHDGLNPDYWFSDDSSFNPMQIGGSSGSGNCDCSADMTKIYKSLDRISMEKASNTEYIFTDANGKKTDIIFSVEDNFLEKTEIRNGIIYFTLTDGTTLHLNANEIGGIYTSGDKYINVDNTNYKITVNMTDLTNDVSDNISGSTVITNINKNISTINNNVSGISGTVKTISGTVQTVNNNVTVLSSSVQTLSSTVKTISGTVKTLAENSAHTKVSFTQTLTAGTKIGSISVDGSSKDLYAPEPSGTSNVSVTQVLTAGTKIGSISVDGTSKDLYAPSGSKVTYTEKLASGTSTAEIGTITIDGVDTKLYCLSGGNSPYEYNQVSVNGIQAKLGSNIARGIYSHAEGSGTTATGEYSFTEGLLTKAYTKAGHAEGSATTASGIAAHAEGYLTVAKGAASHVEGNQTLATANQAHAEGFKSSGTAVQSHAEGYACLASGPYSHAEGFYCSATSNSSHAEGHSNLASGMYSHAEGESGICSGMYSHVEGRECRATGYYSHAGGFGTSATNYCSMAVGGDNKAGGMYSFAGGAGSLTSGRSSFAFGENCSGIGDSSFATGYYVGCACAEGGFACGKYNMAGLYYTGNVSSDSNARVASKILFDVGCGTGTGTGLRKSAMWIDVSGQTWVCQGIKTYSDMRLKDVKDSGFTVSIDDIANAPVFTYVLKNGGLESIGTSAQYWEDKLPQAIDNAFDDKLTLDYTGLLLTSVKSMAQEIKELKAEIEELKKNK